jgi:hypothetical protein
MPAAARYYIFSLPTGYTGGSSQAQRIVQSGKIKSASPSAISEIVTVPPGLPNQDLIMHIEPVYTDAVAKTGTGYAFLQISEPGVDPVPAGTEQPVDAAPRFLMRPVLSPWNTPGNTGLQLAVRPGQRFAIQDNGFAV